MEKWKAMNPEQIKTVLNAQPFAESRNDATRVWQLFRDDVDAIEAIKEIEAAIAALSAEGGAVVDEPAAWLVHADRDPRWSRTHVAYVSIHKPKTDRQVSPLYLRPAAAATGVREVDAATFSLAHDAYDARAIRSVHGRTLNHNTCLRAAVSAALNPAAAQQEPGNGA